MRMLDQQKAHKEAKENMFMTFAKATISLKRPKAQTIYHKRPS